MNDIILAITLFSGISFIAYGISCLTSNHMRLEFERFGLARFRTTVGVLEFLGGAAQLASFLFPPLGILAAGGLAAVMLLGIITRVRVGDDLLVSLPAIVYLLLNAFLLYAAITS